MLASHALALVGVPMRRVIRVAQEQREARYHLLRGYFHGADDTSADAMEQESLRVVTLAKQKNGQGIRVHDARLDAFSVRLISLRRSSGETVHVDNTTLFQSGDTVVLSGHGEDLALAEQHLAALSGAESQ